MARLRVPNDHNNGNNLSAIASVRGDTDQYCASRSTAVTVVGELDEIDRYFGNDVPISVPLLIHVRGLL